MSILSKSVSIVITISVCLAAAHAADVSSQMSNPKDRAALKAELIKEKKLKEFMQESFQKEQKEIDEIVSAKGNKQVGNDVDNVGEK